MKHITFYLDFVSPYAWLAFMKLPQALQGLSYTVDYRPVLLAGLLQHHGQRGPAEIAGKRDWTYRQVLWLAHQHGVPLDMPAMHPFNPLGLLRLALACGDAQGRANRQVCETIFRHAWQGGADAADATRLQALAATLQPVRDPACAEVKARLKANTDDAIASGLFGVPAFGESDRLFWGFDALPMLRASLDGDAWFDGTHWQAAAGVGAGVKRAS